MSERHEPIYYEAAPYVIGGCTCGRVRLPGEWGNGWWERHVDGKVMSQYERLLWRTGRKVGRTIYAVIGDDPSDDDVLIGMMDTPDLAGRAVSDHNFIVRMAEGQP